MFTETFMIRAFLVAVFLCPLCALLGVFVTARRMSFFGETIAHGAFGGVAIGVVLGVANLTLPVIGFSLAMAAALLWLREKTRLTTDTIMALLLTGSISLGMIVLSRTPGKNLGEIHSILFGDILAVGRFDVVLAGVMLAVFGFGVFRYLSQLTLVTAQEELAHVCGVPVRRLNLIFVIVLTLTVAVTVRLVGILLVTPMLVIPAATARNLSRNLRQEIIISLAVGLAAGFLGVALSYHLDTSCGPTVVMSCVGMFLLTLSVRAFILGNNRTGANA